MAPEVWRSTRTKTMPDFFRQQQQRYAVSRKRISSQQDNSDNSDNSSNEEESQDEEEQNELDSDEDAPNDMANEDDSDNEFSLALLTSRESNAKKPRNKTTSKDRTKKTNKKRRLDPVTEITMPTSSQLLEQVSEQQEGTSLYDQVLASDADIDNMVTVWIQHYKDDKIPALQDLINYVIRSAGCRMAVTTEAFANENITVDALQELQEELAKLPHHEYPIISKEKSHKNLKQNLLGFFELLIEQCQHELLYDGTLIETLQSWLTTMSSSVYRPFRHTSTIIALKVTGRLCVLADKTQTDLVKATRQANAERKKGGRNTNRLNILKRRSDLLTQKGKDLDEYVNDFFVSVFAHRSRDVESIIRNECLKELCAWIQLYPARFANNLCFRYFGWALNDPNASVRSESLKAITKLCKTDQMEKLTSFIQRFVARMEEMALYDVDVSTRVHAITLCNTLYAYQHDLIQETSRDALTNLVTSNNSRIRKAAAPFVKSVIESDIFNPVLQQVEQALESLTVASSSSANRSSTRNLRPISSTPNTSTSASTSAIKKPWIVFKSIADFLAPRVRTSESSDGMMSLDEPFVFDQNSIQIIDNTVESLWGLIRELQDYQTMADYLSRDHSSDTTGQFTSNDDNQTTNSEFNACYRLTNVEETILVYVFVSCLKKTIKTGSDKLGEKKKDDVQSDEIRNTVSRHLIQILPKLLRKYGDDLNRLAQLIQVPQLVNLDVYLELRMEESYKELLHHLCKLYTTITLPDLLQTCISSLQHMMKASFLSDTSDPLMKNLQETIVNQVRDACRNKDLYTARFSADDLHAITTSVTRLDYLISTVDITSDMDDTSELKADVTELMGELVERSALGYNGEVQIGQSALSILFRYLIWQCCYATEENLTDFDKTVLLKIEKRRDWLIEKSLELISSDSDSEPLPEVQRLAFGVLIDIYSVFSNEMFKKVDLGQLYLKCTETIQLQLVAYMTGEMKSWIESKNNGDDDTASENVQRDKTCIINLMLSYGRGLAMGVLEAQHGLLLLEQYGQHGDEEMDAAIKAFVEETEISLISNPTMADQICKLYMATLQKTFDLRVDRNHRSLDKTLKLGRLFSQSFKQTNERVNSHKIFEDIVCERIHIDGINFVFDKATESKNDDETMTVALKFFKVLTLFAKQLDRARDVGKIHKHLENRIQECQLKPLEGEKEWEPYYGYTKTMDDLLKKKGLRYDYASTN
ncbi:uncharacterized protein BX664DRAFT_326308 [Halteromyces radiatus]|uniref:uncharacterized protein n=1 Tax=Halteromyces radiatus TaxID=101107 RepID=UPI00221EC2DA|nr:uncharacterized protein BX664DRAFT_326308 [Halteromyces radiatus]KAI8097408.1 hypothetical protein BX664DRAFT_326308 [Halteromyces radiatus]